MSGTGAPSRAPSTLLGITTAPVVITLLFSIAAWTITRSADRLLRQPIIKITERVEASQQEGKDITLTITNITQNTLFKNVTVHVRGETENARFSKPDDRILGSGWDGKIVHDDPYDSFTIVLTQFHPGWKLEVKTTMTSSEDHKVHLENADVATMLQSPGLKTVLIEYEIPITVTMSGVAVFCILLWAWCQRKGMAKGDNR